MNSTDAQGPELLSAYLSGTLEPALLPNLNRCLAADPALRREAAELVLMEIHLREIGEEELGVAPERALAPARVDSGAREGRRIEFTWQTLSDWWRWLAAAGATVALVAVVLIVRQSVGVANSVRLDQVEGRVAVQRAGRILNGVSGTRIGPGDRLVLETNASGMIRFGREKTWVRLTDSARVELDTNGTGKRLTLLAGALSAVVAPQPAESPMVLTTAAAEFTVLGTELAVAAGADEARLEVWRGKVRAVRREDGAFAVVQKGEFLVVRKGLPMIPAAMGTGVRREYWGEMTAPVGAQLSELGCLETEPTGAQSVPELEMPSNWGDAFVARARGYLRPAASGWYTFWVAGDDRAELWLSTDERAVHKRRLCWTSAWTIPRDWDKTESQKSAAVYLEVGRKYYIEALQYENGGADHMSVAWQPPRGPRQLLAGEYLSAFGLPETAPGSLKQP